MGFDSAQKALSGNFSVHMQKVLLLASRPVQLVHFLIFLQQTQTAEVETVRAVLPPSGGMCYLKYKQLCVLKLSSKMFSFKYILNALKHL